MNTFATLLLAFPFYLAMKGRLSVYVALAKPDAGSSAANTIAAASTPSASGMSMNATPTTPITPTAPASPLVTQ